MALTEQIHGEGNVIGKVDAIFTIYFKKEMFSGHWRLCISSLFISPRSHCPLFANLSTLRNTLILSILLSDNSAVVTEEKKHWIFI